MKRKEFCLFLYDALYDRTHLHENGYTSLTDWWTTRVFEWDCLWHGQEEAFNRQERKNGGAI